MHDNQAKQKELTQKDKEPKASTEKTQAYKVNGVGLKRMKIGAIDEPGNIIDAAFILQQVRPYLWERQEARDTLTTMQVKMLTDEINQLSREI